MPWRSVREAGCGRESIAWTASSYVAHKSRHYNAVMQRQQDSGQEGWHEICMTFGMPSIQNAKLDKFERCESNDIQDHLLHELCETLRTHNHAYFYNHECWALWAQGPTLKYKHECFYNDPVTLITTMHISTSMSAGPFWPRAQP